MVETSTHIVVGNKGQSAPRWMAEDELSEIIIQAFRDGEKKGTKNAIKQLVEGFRRDFEISKKIFEAYFQTLSVNGINPQSMRVRIGRFMSFDAIVIIPAKVYNSEEFGKVIELSKSFTSHPTPDISLNYRFMPFSTKINYEELESDGFIASYE